MRENTKRNYGIDLLRIVSMLMVVLVHVLGQGGILANTRGVNNAVVWLLEIMAFSAVDCYALISGYVGYSENEKPCYYRKFLGLWTQIFTYSFGITFVAFLVDVEGVGLKNLFISMFPITFKFYWYACAYVGLFFLIPWINKLLQACSKWESTKFIFIIAMTFIVYVTFSNRIDDCFLLNDGYSFIWLTILYTIGAWIKKCNVFLYLKNSKLLILGGTCILLTWSIKIFLRNTEWSTLLVNYTSFTVVFMAFVFLAIFSKLKIGKVGEKIIRFIAPSTFGVYLIHVHPILYNYLLKDAFLWCVSSSWWMLIIETFVSTFVIFSVCIMIETIRLWLFRVLKVDQLIDKITIIIENFVYKISKKFIYFLIV